MKDVDWLLSYEQFDGFSFGSDDLDIATLAPIVRAATRDAPFVSALVEKLAREENWLNKVAPKRLADVKAGNAILFLRYRSLPSRGRRFAALVQSVVHVGLAAGRRFDELPKRTIREHRKHYESIADLAQRLRSELASESGWAGFELNDDIDDELRKIISFARDAANDAPLSRPTARHARRTYVTREIASWFRLEFGSFKHEATATIINAIFSDAEAVDATYAQSIARTIPPDENQDEDPVNSNPI